jgi:hypothetical protein
MTWKLKKRVVNVEQINKNKRLSRVSRFLHFVVLCMYVIQLSYPAVAKVAISRSELLYEEEYQRNYDASSLQMLKEKSYEVSSHNKKKESFWSAGLLSFLKPYLHLDEPIQRSSIKNERENHLQGEVLLKTLKRETAWEEPQNSVVTFQNNLIFIKEETSFEPLKARWVDTPRGLFEVLQRSSLKVYSFLKSVSLEILKTKENFTNNIPTLFKNYLDHLSTLQTSQKVTGQDLLLKEQKPNALRHILRHTVETQESKNTYIREITRSLIPLSLFFKKFLKVGRSTCLDLCERVISLGSDIEETIIHGKADKSSTLKVNQSSAFRNPFPLTLISQDHFAKSKKSYTQNTFISREKEKSWKEEDYYNQAFATILSLTVRFATYGVGSFLTNFFGITSPVNEAMIIEGFTTLCSQVVVTLFNNGGNFGKTFQTLTSGESIRSLASSILGAGITRGLGQVFDLPMGLGPRGPQNLSQHLGINLLRSGVTTGLSIVIEDAKVEEAFDSGGRTFIANTIGGYVANKIGQDYKREYFSIHKGMRLGLSAITGAILNKHPLRGAIAGIIGGFISGVTAEVLTPNLEELQRDALEKAKILAITEERFYRNEDFLTFYEEELTYRTDYATIVSAFVAFGVGQDVPTAISASSTIENNFIPVTMTVSF